MQSVKKLQIIESIKNMPDKEADILEVFVAGFRAGKMTTMNEVKQKTESKNDSSKQQLYISSPNRKKITHNNQNMECKKLESSVQITLKDIEENASLNHFG